MKKRQHLRQHLRRYVAWFVFAAAIFGACVLNANPQSTKPQTAKAQNPANLELGARIVSQGTTKGVIACARCHGYDGAADGSGAFPALAAQPAAYLVRQLQHYADGKRQNAIMQPIAKRLSSEEIEAVAQYYSGARSTAAPRQNPQELVTRGQQFALNGDSEARVQACISCHGPNGEGMPPDVPYLAGQYQHYIKVQIQMFRLGYRVSAQMKDVAHELPDQHLDAIAAYFDQLALPSQK
jgi:cytochrome c553